jgi:hypothetical protein
LQGQKEQLARLRDFQPKKIIAFLVKYPAKAKDYFKKSTVLLAQSAILSKNS